MGFPFSDQGRTMVRRMDLPGIEPGHAGYKAALPTWQARSVPTQAIEPLPNLLQVTRSTANATTE